MTDTKSTHQARRGRIFPQIQWTQAQQSQWKAGREAFKEQCELIFAQVQPQLIKTHYNWFIAVEPESGEYFLHEDVLSVAKQAQEKYPNAKLHVFRINETGACGRI
ncbi:hypothetical protein [Nostoc sp. MS1]|uniref:hypothetical protein n=1 Tax=Nostoc sp. MS1 TaxID=2764711 RepID=UPI001CC66801|nr:hypothetical protein [Nostoc sp. MS1]BCL38834.1 hypothetical protein NSMS1_52810 [Nostoc sp. MS1]